MNRKELLGSLARGAVKNVRFSDIDKAVDAEIGELKMRKPRFIVLSGSARFHDAWAEHCTRVILEGNVPYTILGDFRHRSDYGSIKKQLDESYQYVITEYADELFVLNVGGYIGDSTRAEIACAERKGIPIHYLETLS